MEVFPNVHIHPTIVFNQCAFTHLFERQIELAEKHKNVTTFMLHLNLSTVISTLTCSFWICETAEHNRL